MDINAEKQKRDGLAVQARAIMTGAEAAGRDMTSEEDVTFDRLMADVDKIDAAVKKEERLRAAERAVPTDTDKQRKADRNGPDRGGEAEEELRNAAFRQFLIGGRDSLSPEQARTMIAGTDPEGGYLVAPMQFVNELIQRVDDAVFIRQYATVHKLMAAASLGIPTLDTDMNDADWTTEILTGSQDDALRLGRRELTPNPLAKRTKISRKLLRLTNGKAEDLVNERLAYKFGVTAEKAYMTGDGNKKPLGVFTASTAGISTGRDVSLGTAGAIPLTNVTGDQLIDAKYTLKAAYWKKARWTFHRDLIKIVRKLKDGDGTYLWKAGLSDKPDTILDLPFDPSEFAPNTVAANQYVGLLGDWSYYHIADSLAMEVQRLVELYAEANLIGFIGRLETDGMPALEEAFVRMKVPA